MSNIDRTVTNHDVIPTLNSHVFDEHPTARLACGLIAVNDVPLPGLESEYASHFELRRRVYVDQTGQLDASELQDDGTDRDPDDARSATFAVFENHPAGLRVLGVARLILRGTDAPLPVEEFCPDSFATGELSPRSVEVSRVIARHETALVQNVVQWHLFTLMLAYIANHELERTFAIIEPWFERHLKSIISITRIGEPRYVEHYLDYNLPIEIDIPASALLANAHNDGFIDRYRAAEPGLTFVGRAARGPRAEQAA
ncbi:hypothetical protein [Leucobacter luti]|uniref:hypothetical protein n=1 Tax=Leucobacter luti TaxID=340320 RepID=UPI00102C43D6|nr:hypothetical protein [Leucobacter luti]MBL3698224.1 hypothetical protein [Leucobacter luti]